MNICEVLLKNPSNDARYVMDSPDDLKMRSSMTLFAEANPEEPVFQKVLDKYFGGKKDQNTLGILKKLKET